MQPKHILALALLTVLAVAGAYFAGRTGDDAASTAAERGAFFPDLTERLNDVTSVTLAKGTDEVALERTDAGWGVASRGGYPAKFQTVKELLLALSELEVEQRKTAKPENYAKLGVEDVGADAGSTRITVGAGGDTLADVLVGTSSALGRDQALNVRRADETQAWLVRGPRVNTAAAPRDWMEREVMKVEGDRVRAATIEHADGEVVRLERAARDSNTFKVANLPDGRLEKYEGVGNAVATALSYFSLEDVEPVGEVDFTAEPRATTTIRCYDGLVVAIETAKVGEDTWARLTCSFDEAAAADAPEGDDAPTALTAADVAAENERVSAWAYQLAPFKADALARRMDELLAEPVVQDAAEAPLFDGLDLGGAATGLAEDPSTTFDQPPVEPPAFPPTSEEELDEEQAEEAGEERVDDGGDDDMDD